MTASITGDMPVLFQYSFEFAAIQRIIESSTPGSAWRGLLGHGLRQSACVTRSVSCEGCLLLSGCVYNRIFESYELSDESRYRKRPHPFVLRVGVGQRRRELQPGDRFGFGLVLFGSARETLPYIIHGMKIAGSLGFGSTKGQFSLVAVRSLSSDGSGCDTVIWRQEDGKMKRADIQPSLPPPPPPLIQIHFETPFRLKERGRLVGPREFTVDHFFKSLWRRSQDIGRFYGGPGAQDVLPEEKPDGIGVIEQNLSWFDWRRFSSRQKTVMNMGGIIGSFTLRNDERIAQWWPLIWYGQWLHVGKATSMGLGRYRVIGHG